MSWEATAFYWAQLEVPSTGRASRAGVVPTAGMLQLADQLPVPIEDVHAVCVPVDGQGETAGSGIRLIACAVALDQLGLIDPLTTALTPRTIPTELGAGDLDPAAFNMLVGDFEPIAARRTKARRRLAVAAVFSTLAALIAIGSVRRANHAEMVRDEARKSTASLLASFKMPKATLAELHAERSRLAVFARMASGMPLPGTNRTRDAAAELQKVLAAWPAASTAKPQSISIGPEGALLSVLVPGDAGAFVGELQVPEGWRLDEPSLAAVGQQTRVNLRLRPVESQPGAEGKGK